MELKSGPVKAVELFGQYQLLEVLGRGGMGEVWRARVTGPAGVERLVALKRVRTELAEKPRFVTRFVEEARLAASLVHPNLVTALDFGRAEDRYFLALELVDGPDLGAALKALGPPPPLVAIYIARQVALGLAFLHRGAGGTPVVHGDVKPGNVLLGRAGVVKLGDLGVARVLDAAQIPTADRGAGATVAYLSPERAAGAPPAPRDDVYALGLVLVGCLTGEPVRPAGRDAAREAALAGTVSGLERARDSSKEIATTLDAALSPANRSPVSDAGALIPLLDIAARRIADQHRLAPETALTRWLDALPSTPSAAVGGMVPGPPKASSTELSQLETSPPLPTGTDDGKATARPDRRASRLLSEQREAQTDRRRRRLLLTGLVAGVGCGLAVAALMVGLGSLPARGGEEPAGPTTASALAATGIGPASAMASAVPAVPAVTTRDTAPEPEKGTRIVGTEAILYSASPGARRRHGTLSLNTPGTWANVRIGGRVLETPIRELRVPVGSHVVVLENPELGVVQKIVVKIRPGEHVTRIVELERP